MKKERKKLTKEEKRQRTKAFFGKIWKWIKAPFVWMWTNLKDWRTAVIFAIVFVVVSSEVWVPYLLGVITWGTTFSKTMFGVGSACWIFWLGPGTPFLPLCMGITVGVKAVFNKIKARRGKKKNG